MKASFSTSNTKLEAQFGVVSEVEKEVLVPIESETDYEHLINKPKINTVELVGDKSFEQLGLERVTNTEIENMFR